LLSQRWGSEHWVTDAEHQDEQASHEAHVVPPIGGISLALVDDTGLSVPTSFSVIVADEFAGWPGRKS
jgi:hypothetical protein